MPRLAALALTATACGNGLVPPASDATASESSSTDTPPTSTGDTSVVGCDPWQPDCPPGERCIWYANDGENFWSATRCEPIMEHPAGLNEPCSVVGDEYSGIDNCDIGLVCLGTDGNQKHCAAHCTGALEAPTCADGYFCVVHDPGFSWCVESCNPLQQDCALDSHVCVFDGASFFCSDFLVGDVPVHGSCTSAYCAPGLACIPSDASLECEGSFLCCEPFCDATLPNTCPGQDQTCVPWYDPGDAPPGFETLGLCSLP